MCVGPSCCVLSAGLLFGASVKDGARTKYVNPSHKVLRTLKGYARDVLASSRMLRWHLHNDKRHPNKMRMSGEAGAWAGHAELVPVRRVARAPEKKAIVILPRLSVSAANGLPRLARCDHLGRCDSGKSTIIGAIVHLLTFWHLVLSAAGHHR